MIWKSLGGVFALWVVFSISQQIIMLIYFPLHSSLFDDLFVFLQFACNLT